jgi:hypothetical protein
LVANMHWDIAPYLDPALTQVEQENALARYGRSSLNQENDLASHSKSDDLIMLDHAFGLFDTERHDPAQGLGSFCNGGATRIVEADLGLHGNVDIAHDWHVCLPGEMGEKWAGCIYLPLAALGFYRRRRSALHDRKYRHTPQTARGRAGGAPDHHRRGQQHHLPGIGARANSGLHRSSWIVAVSVCPSALPAI